MKRFTVFAVFAMVLLTGLSHLGAQPVDKSAFDISGLGPQVTAYDAETITILYFAATWCPSCQAFYKDLQANASTLPKNVKLVFVNYDKASDLKKFYGVISQHTYVQIDSTGAKKNLWVGGSTVNALLKKIGKA